MEYVVLGLGSNKPFDGISCVEILSRACAAISQFISGLELSSVYRTGAMYVCGQDDFYNMVAAGNYSGTPESLLERIHQVENSFGRNRAAEFRNGPRTLDIDIELFGLQTVRTPSLTVPHERLFERSFVLVPLLEVLKKNADANKAGIAVCSEHLAGLKGQRIELFCSGESLLESG